MSTKSKILKILNRRKTGITTFDLYSRVSDVSQKTVRNTLGLLIKEGTVQHDSKRHMRNKRPVTGYLAVR